MLFRKIRFLKIWPIYIHNTMDRSTKHLGPFIKKPETPKVQLDKEQLRQKLSPIQFHVTQEKGTERPFSGEYVKLKDNGKYACVVCSEELFSSEEKYDSGCGWPAFYSIKDQSKVNLTPDYSHIGSNLLLLLKNKDQVRTEVTCANCGAHLGHVFDDGPQPTGIRYCINSASLRFKKRQEENKSTDSNNNPTTTFN